MKRLFKFIKASTFFPAYAPDVNNFNHKIRGKDGNKLPITFTEQDKTSIITGLQQMTNEFKNEDIKKS